MSHYAYFFSKINIVITKATISLSRTLILHELVPLNVLLDTAVRVNAFQSPRKKMLNNEMARLRFQVSLSSPFINCWWLLFRYLVYYIKRRRLCYDINKTKLKIIMSCQRVYCKGATNCFLFFVVFLSKPTAIKLRKQRQHIEWLVSTFRLSRLLCYFPFDFICAFVALNFVSQMEIRSRALKPCRPDFSVFIVKEQETLQDVKMFSFL